MITDGLLIKDETPCYYIYRLTMDGRVQTGIVACSSIDDYADGTIRKHEKTRADKELDRIRHVDACDAQTGPIFLAYRSREEINALVAEVMNESPLYDFLADDGVGHTVWRISEPGRVKALEESFSKVPNTYIADGHHRAASAVKVGFKRREENPGYRGDEPYNYFLSVLFPDDELFIMDYNRVVKDLNGWTKTEFLKRDYPYLVSRQRQFVFDFIKANNHAPLFFLMLQYLRLSENRSNKIYCLLHGIFDGKKRTLYEIAAALNLTRERCRQIASGTIEVQESALANNEGWDYYKNLLELPFIYEKTEEYVRLKDAERLTIDFDVFASLVKLVGDFKLEDVEGHAVLMNKKYKDLKLSDCLDTLFSIIDAKYSTDTYVPIDSVLFTVPEHLRPTVKELIKHIATEICKVQITEDEKLYLPQNYIDIAEELYDILSKKGEPMHVEDIFKEFKTRYPDHKYTDPLQIKSYLFRHKHIKAVGKTSCYALDSWEGVYFGSIRDLLVDLLSDSDVPLHIDNLYDGVTEHYPNTTKASVAATMEDENLQRFIEFEGSFFGLTSKEYPAEFVPTSSVQRYRFEDRFQMFKDFVETYHRFPSYNGSEKEASLMRWLYNATNDVLTITEGQKSLLDATTKRYDDLGYPRSATESEFLLKCMDVKDYIRQHHTLPTNREAPELYAWLRRSRDNYDSFTDKRRQYMADLLNFVLSLGFSI